MIASDSECQLAIQWMTVAVAPPELLVQIYCSCRKIKCSRDRVPVLQEICNVDHFVNALSARMANKYFRILELMQSTKS